MELALGSWSIIKTTPSLLALIPLVAYLIMVFMNKSNLAGLVVGVIVAAILTGQNIQKKKELHYCLFLHL